LDDKKNNDIDRQKDENHKSIWIKSGPSWFHLISPSVSMTLNVSACA